MELASFVLNIGVALTLGMVIGLERQFRQHPAGLRTNALVCLGAALFVSLALLIDHEAERARIAAQVVSGLGFLGGGVILREGLNVRGMNTAATIWCSGAIGTLAGSGRVVEGAVGAAAVLATNVVLRPIVQGIDSRMKTATNVETLYRVRVTCAEADEGVVRLVLMRHVNSQTGMVIQGLARQNCDQAGRTMVVAEVFSHQRDDKYLNELVSRLGIEPTVSAVSWERA